MKVVILGSGVVGLTSAWYLSQAGCQVTVVDRQPRAAEETSFANAGQISYGYSSPWAAPGVPLKAMKWLLEEHAPLKIKPSLNPELLHWASQMLKNCQLDRYRINKARMLAIANRSRECLAQLNQQYDLNYQGRTQGTLQIFRNHKQLEAVEKDIALLEESGTRYQLLDAKECLLQEPGLANIQGTLTGGLYLPDDETGDCYLFCQQLQAMAENAGVEFLFNTEIQRLNVQGNQVTSVATSQGEIEADKFVVAMGSYSKSLLEQVGIDIPLYPVKGYSLTLPVINRDFAPQSTIMDETYKVAVTRFENRIRVAGTAELAGFDPALPDKRLATLNHVVANLFPQGTDLTQAEYWTGFRPMTPDGTPIIGETKIENLFTNTGHGTLGWTMACGSADILTEVITRSNNLQYKELSSYRYGK
ncbi:MULTISPECIES: D-amino acid dehydrogenase [unclassified Vibrio]|uniref:D-amino acid dehydrogenase n=1 Tax=unclassified Vibrio TaxID=2614977 RepID=UPI001268ED01|nr:MULTISPECIES: D-amino acid dehydrogenase [unclassified Vibrio]MCM5509849.1 D-amino acid dehydrogenase [Vibrio sp. SCSIO 43169]QFT35507.1 D-amino acid dehydrogenase small subunit [Vibrio sp. THAF64]QGM33406.1 D-amino acid dehydrogenase small subunit [Vibrio sp. THAF191d]QGN68908.1 D-amino acid dehydrogenase small subunit [Vibrio sp. THAF191c]